jgi:hypothetical protein
MWCKINTPWRWKIDIAQLPFRPTYRFVSTGFGYDVKALSIDKHIAPRALAGSHF